MAAKWENYDHICYQLAPRINQTHSGGFRFTSVVLNGVLYLSPAALLDIAMAIDPDCPYVKAANKSRTACNALNNRMVQVLRSHGALVEQLIAKNHSGAFFRIIWKLDDPDAVKENAVYFVPLHMNVLGFDPADFEGKKAHILLDIHNLERVMPKGRGRNAKQ